MRVSKRFRLTAVAAASTVAVTTGVVSGLGPVTGGASSHREAPLISADPQVDTTDVYAFRSPDDPKTVTLIASWNPFEEPAGGPNFYAFDDNAVYDLKVDNNGNAKPDVIFRYDFEDHYRSLDTFLYNNGQVTSLGDENLNFFQTYDLWRLTPHRGRPTLLLDDAPVAPSDVGDASMPDYENQLFLPASTALASGGQAWAGQSDDPFFLDLRVFDLLYGANLSEADDETLLGFNVQTTAIQVPMEMVAREGDPTANPIIGVWATASRRGIRVQKRDGSQRFHGPLVQVSRLGMPLVNELVIPLEDKDLWNGSEPQKDAQFLEYVTNPELDQLIAAVYPGLFPNDPFPRPRNDLVQVFLTGIAGLNQPPGVRPSEMIRLNMSTEVCVPPPDGTCATYSPLGVIGGDVAGYPNGRRLADDTIDISLQVVEGELIGNPNDLADGVNENPEGFRTSFPYVQIPTSGSDADPH